MTHDKTLLVLHAADGQPQANILQNRLKAHPSVQVVFNPSEIPPPQQRVVVVFLLTPQAIQDTALANTLKACQEQAFPILPVVEDVRTYNFGDLPPPLKALSERNAVSWKSPVPNQPDGELVVQDILCWLGLELFERERRLFISYKRSDGTQAATELFDHFRHKGYQVFMDNQTLEGGDRVQSEIHRAIYDYRLVVLVQSPQAHLSDWVWEEVYHAQAKHVKIITLTLDDADPMHRVNGSVVLPYAGAQSMALVENTVKEAIASQVDFDRKVIDTVKRITEAKQWKFKEIANHKQVVIQSNVGGTTQNIMLEYEDAPHSLEKLYGLHLEHHGNIFNVMQSFLVFNGPPLSVYQQNAVDWARQGEPLRLIPLKQLYTELS